MTDGVTETHFDNGLVVLSRELHNAPVATLWVWYRVGSRNEVPGITGASHWVEHMMFKGTGRLQKGDVFKRVSENGGANNAFTWMDYTAYFETLPSDRLDLAIEIESDRMVNAVFDPDEVTAERTVIISEREGAENDPEFWLQEAVQAAAFVVHPYHHETLGYKTDLTHITRDDLYRQYRTYYIPNNVVVVAAGDFDTPSLLDLLRATFGQIPKGGEAPRVQVQEPPQEGERRVVVRRPGPANYFQVAYHAPRATDPDFFPCYVLAGVLGGASSMAMSRSSPGRSSRLYRALVETELASSVHAGFVPTLDPYLLDVSATARPGVKLDTLERAVFQELEKIATKPIGDHEFAKILKQTRAHYVYAEDGVNNHAYRLGMLEMVASHKLYDSFLASLEAVSKEDVRRVAAKYLAETNRTVGWFIPTNGSRPPRRRKAPARKSTHPRPR